MEELGDRILPPRLGVALHRAPGPDVVGEVAEPPDRLHRERRGSDRLEWELEGLVLALEMLTPRRPEGADLLGEEPLDDDVDLGGELVEAVPPDHHDPSWLHDPATLGGVPLHVEPVRRLGRGGEIDALRFEAARPLIADAVLDPRRASRFGDLLWRDVGPDDPAVVLGEAEGGLSVAAPGIPGQFAPDGLRGKPGVQLHRIGGAVAR